MYFILPRRALKGVLANFVEIAVAIVLLRYSLSWFLLFWFVQSIYAASARYDANRSLIRCYQIANECKIIAMMKKLGVSTEDATKEFEMMKGEMTEKQFKELEKDFRVAGL
jgi:hypothetical protein